VNENNREGINEKQAHKDDDHSYVKDTKSAERAILSNCHDDLRRKSSNQIIVQTTRWHTTCDYAYDGRCRKNKRSNNVLK